MNMFDNQEDDEFDNVQIFDYCVDCIKEINPKTQDEYNFSNYSKNIMYIISAYLLYIILFFYFH